MGILNVTPDSFSDGGLYLHPKKAVARALQMEAEGADLIDLGGESTRPGAAPVSPKEELKRILPVLERLQGRLRIPLSIDTSKAAVAKRAIECGASLVNDVTALRDPHMAEVVSEKKVPVILMHMRGNPRTMQKNPRYSDLIPEILSKLRQAVLKAIAQGIAKEKILIDPGIGFGKSPKHNLRILKSLRTFKKLGFPLVVGPSRKSFIGHVLHTPAEDRLFGTAAAVALCVAGGADIIRVHDVAAMRQVVLFTEAILNA